MVDREFLKTKLSSYEDWKHCITVSCQIPLTRDYIDKRISELNDSSNQHTQTFINSWGKSHLQQVLSWFKQAKLEIK